VAVSEPKAKSAPPPAAIVEPTSEPEPEPKAEPVTEKKRAPEVAQAMRARRIAEKQQQRTRRNMGIWSGIGASFVMVLALAWVFKVNVVQIWPKTASAYAALGAEVNLYGLEIQDIAAVRKIKDGGSVLQISGHVVNISKKPQSVPLLRAQLLDEHGQTVFSWMVEPQQTRLEASLTLPFVTEVHDPPPDALNVEIVFADEPVQAKNSTETKTKHEEEAHEPASSEH